VKVLVDRRQGYAAITLSCCLFIAAFIAGYYQVQAYLLGIDVIGQTFVDSEFPAPELSPFYLKPATWLMITIIIAWYAFIELIKDRVRRERRFVKSLITSGLLLAIILSFYEVAYNFMMWGVLMVSSNEAAVNPDTVINMFPSDRYKVNLVFATKSFVTILGCGLYAFYVLREERGYKI
jgi:hypothetical protein